MLLIIFGAGASYDSAPTYLIPAHSLERPPLANQLFDDRDFFGETMRRFPACQSIVPFLRHRDKDETVERRLKRLQTDASKHPQGFREMAAIRYYLQWMINECESKWRGVHRGVTNYKTLLYLIRQNRRDESPVCLVTFNYDTMLEDALATVESTIDSISDYVHGGDYKLVKIHGSVNWGRCIEPLPLKDLHALREDQIVEKVIWAAPQIFEQKLVSTKYVLLRNVAVTKFNGQAVFPAIAIPVESKLDFECPSDHVDALKTLLPQTSKLLTIGWRATDQPFLDLLKEHLPRHISAMAVAGSREEAHKVVERFDSTAIRRKEFLRAEGGFSDFIRSGEAEEFLKK